MFDPLTMRLGKKPPKIDSRTLQLAKYFTSAIPPAPENCNWFKDVTTWGAMLNNNLGDCVCAMTGHGVQVASLNSPDNEITPPDPTILDLYENACGYVNGDPSTDQGCVIIDVLNYIRNNVPWKFKHADAHPRKRPYQLIAYADPNPGDVTHIKQAISIFGTVGIGLNLPITAQSQIGEVWDVVGNPNSDPNSMPGSWGGHAVIVAAYDANTLTCITWGALQQMTWNFWATYVDEAHALLFRSWLQQFGAQYPEMLQQLEADLALVTN